MQSNLAEDFSAIEETLRLLIEESSAAIQRCRKREHELEEAGSAYLEKTARSLLPDLKRRTFRKLAEKIPTAARFEAECRRVLVTRREPLLQRMILRRAVYRRLQEDMRQYLRDRIELAIRNMSHRPRWLAEYAYLELEMKDNWLLLWRLEARKKHLTMQLEALTALRSSNESDERTHSAIAEAAHRARACHAQPIVPSLLAEDNDNFCFVEIETA